MITVAVVGVAIGVPLLLWRLGNRYVWRIERDYYRQRAAEERDPSRRSEYSERAAMFDRLLEQ